MGTITANISLSSSDVLPSPMSVTAEAVLSADSGSLVRAQVKGTTADTDDLVLYKANDKLERAYLYIKNLDSELENYIIVRNETESNTAVVAKIGGGEFAFIPVGVDKTYEAIGTKANQTIEYGVFGFDNSSVSLA
tara:strand:+ start:1769 stop:2176 length:408 start_codon:yes stop_codon:yes gene_type:complete